MSSGDVYSDLYSAGCGENIVAENIAEESIVTENKSDDVPQASEVSPVQQDDTLVSPLLVQSAASDLNTLFQMDYLYELDCLSILRDGKTEIQHYYSYIQARLAELKLKHGSVEHVLPVHFLNEYFNNIAEDDEDDEEHCYCPRYKAIHVRSLKCLHSWCEYLNHDCMWTGLCVNHDHREYNKSMQDPKAESRFISGGSVSPGKSVLIPKLLPVLTELHSPGMPFLEGPEGDSLRPDTPMSSDSDGDLDCFQGNLFKHDDLCFDSLLDCCVPMSEVLDPRHIRTYVKTSQLNDRRKEEETAFDETKMVESPDSMLSEDARSESDKSASPALTETEQNWKTTLNDHCYHLNTPESGLLHPQMENLGVQTPSDSEEEIDVVSFDKPAPRPTATLPTYPQSSEQQQYQLLMDNALREKTKQQKQKQQKQLKQQQQQQLKQQQQMQGAQPQPRPRGRPRGSTGRKRNAQIAQIVEQPLPAKRTRSAPTSTMTSAAYAAMTAATNAAAVAPTRPYVRKVGRNGRPLDDSDDSERRSTHNDMERTRRSQLKSHFEYLRLQVPAIENNEKAAKVEILRQSRTFIKSLEHNSGDWEHEHSKLRNLQLRLKSRLSVARREFAARGWKIQQ